LKNIAIKAYQEMLANLSGGVGNTQAPNGTGYLLMQMISGWQSSTASADDYSAINLGQLKGVAKLFYDRLIAVGYCPAYPWAGGTADDYSGANLGQVKNLFSFDITKDSDGDGIPDWWEIHYGLNPYDASDAGHLSLDGEFTNLQKYLQGLNPTLADSDGDGIPDAAEITAGSNPTKKDAPIVGLQVTGYTAP
jgi:hypothetical protein